MNKLLFGAVIGAIGYYFFSNPDKATEAKDFVTNTTTKVVDNINNFDTKKITQFTDKVKDVYSTIRSSV